MNALELQELLPSSTCNAHYRLLEGVPHDSPGSGYYLPEAECAVRLPVSVDFVCCMAYASGYAMPQYLHRHLASLGLYVDKVQHRALRANVAIPGVRTAKRYEVYAVRMLPDNVRATVQRLFDECTSDVDANGVHVFPYRLPTMLVVRVANLCRELPTDNAEARLLRCTLWACFGRRGS